MLEPLKIEVDSWSDAADWRALEERLGAPDEALSRSASVFGESLTRIRSAEELRKFVTHFQAETLAREELPAILRARHHALHNESREIIAMDRAMEAGFASEALANASRRAGRNQLRRMRALKTERVVTRYWDAVHAKQAAGWHTIVFGIVLAVYSIPLRQGLHHYSAQTVRGFLDAGGATLGLRIEQIAEIELALAVNTPALVESALTRFNPGEIRCV